MATFELSPQLSDEYNHVFALARIRPEHRFEVDAIVDRIFGPRNIAQYQRVETSTRVPAFVVGIIHNLEASLSFEGISTTATR